MVEDEKSVCSCRRKVKGNGLVNSLINKLPIELHLPGYQYCGPGTKLKDRLNRGDPGINVLDKACKEHDIAYSEKKDKGDRHIADKILASKAWSRAKSTDANLSERANALLVTNMMNAKVKLGMGVKHKKSLANKSLFKYAVQNAKKVLYEENPSTMKQSIKLALSAARKVVKKKKNKNIKIPRIIPVPKIGGVIPFLVPLFAGLSAIGALTGGAAGVAKAVISANEAKKQFKESNRHNQTMEAIAMGRGLYLKPYKTGLGLFLHPTPKN